MSETRQSIERLITIPLTEEERARTQNDLEFIDRVTKSGKDLGYRVIIHGGYAVDGNLGVITRPHKDLDIQIYGQEPDANKALTQIFGQIEGIEDKGRQDYYHNLLIKRPDAAWVDLYYLQVTTDPFGEEKIIVKKDGSLSDKQSFGKPNIVTLEGVTFEASDAVEELVDKIHKRDNKGYAKEPKHDQDINNLRLITNASEVEEELAQRTKRK